MSQNDLRNYFVKFVPYNENVLSTLINKTIKLSTVYEFNDFNELRYLPHLDLRDEEFMARIKEIFLEKFKNTNYKYNFNNYCSLAGTYKKEYQKSLEMDLNQDANEEIFKKHYASIQEYLAFSSVGILCISSINVFNDDAASLMFAHYGDNLKGLALIYEINKTCHVNYDTKSVSQSGGQTERIFRWLEGEFDRTYMDDFLAKSEKWEYEKESRLFSTPGIKLAEECGVKLKAIIYTKRFNEKNLLTLKNINEKFYESKINLQEVYASRTFNAPAVFKTVTTNLKVNESLKTLEASVS